MNTSDLIQKANIEYLGALLERGLGILRVGLTVSAGYKCTAAGTYEWVAGRLFEDR